MEGQPRSDSVDDQVTAEGGEGRRAADVTPPIADDASKGQTQTPPEPGDVGVPPDEVIAEEEREASE
jgi:hypothetical protein